MRALVLLLFVACSLVGRAQGTVTLFHSHEELLQGRGKDGGEFVDTRVHMGRHVLVLRQDGKEVKVPFKKLWGFSLNLMLFRVLEPDQVPLRVMLQGGLCYYEPGLAHLRMWRDSSTTAMVERGPLAYLSRDLSSPIIPAEFGSEEDPMRGDAFRREHPQFEQLFACIGKGEDVEHTRQCVVDFEVLLEQGPR